MNSSSFITSTFARSISYRPLPTFGFVKVILSSVFIIVQAEIFRCRALFPSLIVFIWIHLAIFITSLWCP